MELTSIIDIIFSLLTLLLLEIVLGIDNLVFLSVISGRLPKHQQKAARRIGLTLALVFRLVFLFFAVWLTRLNHPLFSIANISISIRDIILLLGGLFLLYKGTQEIHAEFEFNEDTMAGRPPIKSPFMAVIIQIAVLDMVFSIDSIFTAIGMTDQYWIMATAIIIAIILMMIASEPLSKFIQENPTIKMLALSFILLVGMMLIADGAGFHIPRGYIYFAICFSLGVETLNTLYLKKKRHMKKNK